MRVRGHLMLAVLLYLLSVRYLSCVPELLVSPFFAFYCLTVMVGALFPDVDWALDRVIPRFGHRNPLTLSLLLPVLLYLPIYYYELSQPLLINFYDAFTFGVGTHLLGDVIKRGNLVWLESRKHEYTWYLLNGIVLVVLLNLTGFIQFVDLGNLLSLYQSSPWLSFLGRQLFDQMGPVVMMAEGCRDHRFKLKPSKHVPSTTSSD